MATLGTIIKKYRKDNRIGLREFAVNAGLSRSYINMLERNARPETGEPPVPSLSAIIGIAAAMDMDTMTLMQKIGIDIKEKEQEVKMARAPFQAPGKNIKADIVPFQYTSLTDESIIKAAREGRLLITPFKLPTKGCLVYIPNAEYNMVIAHSVTKVEGGVYEACAEVTGNIKFSIFDINHTVFMSRSEAHDVMERIRLKEAQMKGGKTL